MTEKTVAKARTTWRRWVFRGYVALTLVIAVIIGLADPFDLAGKVDGFPIAVVAPPLLFLGLAAGLGWLILLVFTPRRHLPQQADNSADATKERSPSP